MTQQEFEAVLALHGWELKVFPINKPSDELLYLARVVQPIKSDDVSQGPFRYEGMVKVIMEIGTVTREQAVNALIELYQQGHIK